MKQIVILGSTGSIGTSALDVIRMHPDKFSIAGLAAHSNQDILLKQAREFNVKRLALVRPYEKRTSLDDIIYGENCATELIRQTQPDIVVNGISGAAGFLPSLETVRHGATLALANKESLVIGGSFLKSEAEAQSARIVPVDSEHCAIFQCLVGEEHNDVRRIILTASGGPFWQTPRKDFPRITPEQALNHPKWEMGKRITIDSATMMNKGLEIIEASWLFDLPINKIDVCIHPQSIIHSMVEFCDLSIKAQLSNPDMRLAIAYALFWPQRLALDLEPIDLSTDLVLELLPPDTKKFTSITLARHAMQQPRSLPCIMNAADEVAVQAFLKGRLRFDQIIPVVEKTMDALSGWKIDNAPEVMDLDHEARHKAEEFIR
ncbi:MAG: 1-deoxy-D-xylulose-5-phosphate reductoisomerase [Deltaproteobacteria bacterium]|nr:1-deoxy-D-xylulose-5-phosphate reductoisomerase [Deltaproteobacteria bacterium]